MPFHAGSKPDDYLLNLFCCKRDRAEWLAAQGYLHDPTAGNTAYVLERRTTVPDGIEKRDAYSWRRTIAELPYGVVLANQWERFHSAGHRNAEVDQALSLYAVSRDSMLSSGDRFRALEASFALLDALCDRQPSRLRLASFARVARDFGARTRAVLALQQLCQMIFESNEVILDEPFLVPADRFDSVPPGKQIGNWLLAAVLEEFERLGSFSSFYTGETARQRLDMIRNLGFASAEMERRRELLEMRFGRPAP